MFRTTFGITKMDCPSEEQMIRTKLAGTSSIHALVFDIPSRKLEIHHTGRYEDLLLSLESLHLGTSVISSEEAPPPVDTGEDRLQTRILWQVLIINVLFFVVEMIAGVIAGSMGLAADSLDMLADGIVYALALFAVGGVTARKRKVAGIAGYFQGVLGILGFIEVIHRFLGRGETPDFLTMIVVSLFSLAANAACVFLLQRSKREVHMQASLIFTSMDVIANLGVIVAGVLVYFTRSNIPDLVVGSIVFILVLQGAYRILKLAK
ncbi:MAG: cation transporter [Syntrophorhabdaceae bacterium]|nr:cation transporter [Syntrophorhabdaceae bacterium]